MRPFRLILPHGGYGLGNDLIPWAKAYILGRELDAEVLHPAWGNNRREYWRYFGTSRLDWQWYRVLLRMLPRYAFDEKTYFEIGENDFVRACRRFSEISGLREKKAFIVTVTGMWGAFAGLEAARPFVLGQLHRTRFTQDNLFSVAKLRNPSRISVGVHIRRGDFRAAEASGYEGAWNTAVPLEWYMQVCRQLVDELGRDNLEFLVATDAAESDVAPFLNEFPCILMSSLEQSVCSDLIMLADADLLVCSLSTYSMWGAFLSRAPYIWFRPHLSLSGDTYYMKNMHIIGIFEDAWRPGAAAPAGRGVPVGMGEVLPKDLAATLRDVLGMKRTGSDLVRGGVVPAFGTASGEEAGE